MAPNVSIGAPRYRLGVPAPVRTSHLARRLGARIRAIRAEVGITQETLAWESGVSKSYVSEIEAGKSVPTIHVLVALARRLGCEPGDLLGYQLSRPRLALQDAARRGNREAFARAARKLKLLP